MSKLYKIIFTYHLLSLFQQTLELELADQMDMLTLAAYSYSKIV